MGKKICHITSAHNRYDVRIFHKECKSLAKNGYNVTLIVNDDKEDEYIENVKIVSTKFKPKNRLERFMLSKRLLFNKVIKVNADIYHLHDPDLLTIGLELKKLGKKVIYDSHEDVPRQILSKCWISKPLRKLVSFVFEKFENRVATDLDAIVTPTPHISSRFKRLNNNVIQVCNFPLLNEFCNYKSKFPEKQVVCYIGGISINRGIKQMVKAVNQVKIELRLCGRFESEKLKNEIITISKYVNYLGILDRKGVSQLLTESMLGLVTLLPTPNHINSYPIKMFEYMAAGIPVIASNFPLWVEIIEKYKCGICVNPNDVNEIVKAINYIINNPEQAKQMGENGRKAVMEKYNWGTQEKILLDLYEKL